MRVWTGVRQATRALPTVARGLLRHPCDDRVTVVDDDATPAHESEICPHNLLPPVLHRGARPHNERPAKGVFKPARDSTSTHVTD